MDEKFSSLESLYIRLKPALKTKVHELHLNHMIYIHEKDVWDYLRVTKWNRSQNLTLFDMVDDILNTKNEEIDRYVQKMRQEILHGE